VGLGETPDQIESLLRDLREAQVDVATLGQYLQPARRNLKVAEYVTPAQFDAYRDYGLSIGFKMVFSGPLVRSSYMADVVNDQAVNDQAVNDQAVNIHAASAEHCEIPNVIQTDALPAAAAPQDARGAE